MEETMVCAKKGILIAIAAIMLLNGCVAKGEFLTKQAEADALRNELATLEAMNKNLSADNEKLISENEALRGKEAIIKSRCETLAEEKKALEKSANQFKEEANSRIENLLQLNVELAGDKQMLAESIALLQKNKEQAVKKVSGTYESLFRKMEKEIQEGQIAITELKGKLTVDVIDKILFDSGKAEIKPAGLEVLDRVVEILATTEGKAIRVEGHTDNVPIGGQLAKKYPTNWELSAARALTVVRYLETKGLDPRLLSAVAFGEHQPVADNETPEGRSRNRRIAIVLQSQD